MPGSRGRGGGRGRGPGGRGGGGKHVQNMRRATPDSQAYPEAVRQNFASLVKVFFGIIQCLHHGHNLDGQRQGRNSAKAFQGKVKELNSFVRPARSGPWVQAEISKINESWAMQVRDALAQHYQKVLADLERNAKDLITGLDWPRAQQIAETWAQRNYKRKLGQNTLTSFRDIVKRLTQSGPPVNTPTPAPRTRESPQGSGRGKTTGNPPSLTSPSRPVSQPRPPVPLSNRFSPLASTSYSDATATPVATLPPSSPVSSTTSSPPSSPKGTGPKVTRPVKPAGSGQRFTAERTQAKNRLWRLPAISDNVETLVVGTSNIDKITMPVDSSTALWSFPGARFDNFVALFERAIQSGVCEHVKNVILSCGINDRGNRADVTTFPRYKRACNAIRDLFPMATVYFVLPNWSEGLTPKEKNNLTQFSGMTTKENKGLVHLIPQLPISDFKTVQDNVHWTEITANRMLGHWLSYISQPADGSKDHHQNSKN